MLEVEDVDTGSPGPVRERHIIEDNTVSVFSDSFCVINMPDKYWLPEVAEREASFASTASSIEKRGIFVKCCFRDRGHVEAPIETIVLRRCFKDTK